ncbi:ATP-binding cassette domain-containing protein [archaeon]|nr:MAG: ATP-binding cassette domain-containing protein [archaeon]
MIPSFPGERGESSGDLRRLSIAMEISDLPPLIIVDEPTINLDVALSLNIMHSLQTLARRGHMVICSMSKPYPQELDYIDRLVVISEGYSIYASPTRHVQRYFSSSAMGYDVRKGMDIAEFLIDVANGTERPIQSRAADLPFIMQQKYEESDVYETIPNSSAFSISAFNQDFFYLLGYGRIGDRRYALNRLITVVKRAIYTKCRDFEQIKMNLIGPVVIGIIYGYLNLQTGSFGRYCTAMFGIPYAQTTNIGGLFFFIASFSFMLPHVSSHVVCQKIELFRYEQASGVCTSFAFVMACLFSEVPFAVVGSLLLSSIVYGFTDLGTDGDDYSYFAEVMILLNLLGVVGSYWFGLMIRRELIIRDLILIIVVLVAILSGFPVQLETMPEYIASAAQLNPLRWAFEGLMAWKFSEYDDGAAYLLPYSFDTFNHNHAKSILNNFIWFTFAAALLFSLNTPLLLRKITEKDDKKPGMDSKSRDSIDSMGGDFPHPDDRIIPRKLTRQSEAVKPVLFMRESSVTGKQSNLSVSLSQTGELNSDRGPTVAFKDVNFRVLDKESPGGYRTVLSRVSGQFDWGKLSCVMGSTGSGKSSLLHVLAGDVPMGAEIGGSIYFNEKKPDPSQLLWQRCGFVPIANEHLRDLTVREVVRFAMLLRCYNSLGLSVVEENVDKTIQILSLTE